MAVQVALPSILTADRVMHRDQIRPLKKRSYAERVAHHLSLLPHVGVRVPEKVHVDKAYVRTV